MEEEDEGQLGAWGWSSSETGRQQVKTHFTSLRTPTFIITRASRKESQRWQGKSTVLAMQWSSKPENNSSIRKRKKEGLVILHLRQPTKVFYLTKNSVRCLCWGKKGVLINYNLGRHKKQTEMRHVTSLYIMLSVSCMFEKSAWQSHEHLMQTFLKHPAVIVCYHLSNRVVSSIWTSHATSSNTWATPGSNCLLASINSQTGGTMALVHHMIAVTQCAHSL